MNSSRRLSWFFFDKYLLLSVLLLSLIGVAFIYSANYERSSAVSGIHFPGVKQGFYLMFGIGIMGVMSLISYKKLAEHSMLIFLACLLVLSFTLIFGKMTNHSRRWISLGIFTVQPSEFVKVFSILTFAHFLDKYRDRMQEFGYILAAIGIFLTPIILIFLQPDLGTALIFFPIMIVMMFMSRVNVKHFFGILVVGGLSVSLPLLLTLGKMTVDSDSVILEILGNSYFILTLSAAFFLIGLFLIPVNFQLRNLGLGRIIYMSFAAALGTSMALIVQHFLLKEYQRERLLAFINPHIEKWGLGYNVIQSQITVGSGQFLGKGWLNGTQGQLGFLPARSTDFIFSVIGEEMGFVGSIGVLSLYFFFISRLIKIAREVKDYLGGMIVIGITTMFTVQIFINIGMTIGVAPVTGLPLPFLTSGGSTLWASLMAVGMIFNIEINKHVHH